MKFLHSSDADFESKFSQLVRRSDNDMSAVMPVVTGIIDEIRKDGDSVLFAQISKFHKQKRHNNRCKRDGSGL